MITRSLNEARARFRQRSLALRAAAILIVQTSAAAGIAWFVANDLIGHSNAFFAPIAAIIVLGIAPGGHARRATEIAVGVAVGIGVADLLIRWIGTGPVQIAVVVLLASVAVVLLGGGPLVAAQAGSSAILLAALPGAGAGPYRFVDALVGGGVGLAMLIAVPRNPVTALRRAVEPPLAELAAVLEEVGRALESRDAQAAGEALEHARATTELADAFHRVLEGARETARLAPTQWSSQDDVERYARAAVHATTPSAMRASWRARHARRSRPATTYRPASSTRYGCSPRASGISRPSSRGTNAESAASRRRCARQVVRRRCSRSARACR